jgi:hypothetical protein
VGLHRLFWFKLKGTSLVLILAPLGQMQHLPVTSPWHWAIWFTLGGGWPHMGDKNSYRPLYGALGRSWVEGHQAGSHKPCGMGHSRWLFLVPG